MPKSENLELARLNRKKYLKAPTIEQIEAFIKKCDVTDAQFERFFGMFAGVIKNVRAGNKPLPANYWHIIYEQIIPTYGSIINKSVMFKSTVSKPVPKTFVRSKSKRPPTDSKLGQLMT